MKIKQMTNNILTLYTIAAIIAIIVGVITNSDFLLVIGGVVAVLGGLFVTNYRTKHIIEILKQNNLWTDEVFEKKKDETKPKQDGFS